MVINTREDSYLVLAFDGGPMAAKREETEDVKHKVQLLHGWDTEKGYPHKIPITTSFDKKRSKEILYSNWYVF